MKVIEVCATYPPRTGGVERHVSLLSESLSDNGFEVEVFTTEPNATGMSVDSVDGTIVKRFPSFAPFGTLYYSPTMTRALKKVEADVVHAHGFRSLPMLSAAFARKKNPFKLVVTTHLGFPKLGSIPYLFYNPLFGRMIFEKAERIILVCRQEFAELPLLESFSTKVEIVPNGIETVSSDYSRVTGGKSDRRLNILCVSRLERKKGIDAALRVLAQIPDQRVSLDVIGEGPHLDKLRRLASSLQIGSRVRFHGRVDNGTLEDFYSKAHILLHLSEYESFGIVIIEAMNAGVVPVATNVGGIPYTMGRRAGFLVDWPVDVKAVARLVMHLNADRDLMQRVAREGWKRVRGKFDIQKIASRIGRIYKTL